MNLNKYLFSLPTTLALCLALAACGPAVKPEDPDLIRLQGQLQTLRSDSRLAPRAQEEIRAAENAVQAIVDLPPRAAPEERAQRLYLAERRILIAEHQARARAAEADVTDLERERDRLQTEARRQEAERARTQAAQEREAAERARREAELAQQVAAAERAAAEEARQAAQQAQSEAEQAQLALEEMRAKLEELEARPTPRGLLLTLGDVLFEVNQAELKEGTARNLRPLVEVLQQDETRSVTIEGHTDSTGSRDYNLGLSLRRAESVRDYLVRNGVDRNRLSVAGLGPDFPIATNETSEGRQRNRRVEVIISDADRQ